MSELVGNSENRFFSCHSSFKIKTIFLTSVPTEHHTADDRGLGGYSIRDGLKIIQLCGRKTG